MLLQDASQIWEPEGTWTFVPAWCWTHRVESISPKQPSPALGSPFLPFLTPLAYPVCLGPSATNKAYDIFLTQRLPSLPNFEFLLQTSGIPNVGNRVQIQPYATPRSYHRGALLSLVKVPALENDGLVGKGSLYPALMLPKQAALLHQDCPTLTCRNISELERKKWPCGLVLGLFVEITSYYQLWNCRGDLSTGNEERRSHFAFRQWLLSVIQLIWIKVEATSSVSFPGSDSFISQKDPKL